MPENADQKLVEYIQHTSVALEKAAAADNAAKQAAVKVAAALPGAVEAMIASGVVKEADRDRLTASLNDHGTTLDLLRKTAARVNQAPTTIGEPASKQASATMPAPQREYFGGSRSSSNEGRASFANFAQGLGYNS